MATAGEGHPQYPGTAPASAHGVQGGRPLEVVYLGFLPGRVTQYAGDLWAGIPQLADKAFDAGILVAEAVLRFEILPDTLGCEPPGQSFYYLVSVRLT